MERAKRSRVSQLVQVGGLVRGNLVKMARTCGNPGCRCVRQGKKHISWYLAVSRQGRKRMLYLAPEWEKTVKEWVKRYRDVRELLEDLSELYWERVRRRNGGSGSC